MQPIITEFETGTIMIGDSVFKDAMIYPGTATAWDWSVSNTHHSPGIQIADVRTLVENGATVVVLSKGVCEKLQLAPETKKWLSDNKIELHHLETRAAVEKYNKLASKQSGVGALIHSTC